MRDWKIKKRAYICEGDIVRCYVGTGLSWEGVGT